MAITLSKSDKEWHRLWFYLKNDAATPLPLFFGRLIEETPQAWGWACREGEEEATQPHQCHRAPEKQQAPWARCHQSIPREKGGTANGMRPPTVPDGAWCAVGQDGARPRCARDNKIVQCIREAAKETDAVFQIPGHPMMRPDEGFVDLVSSF
jgi:hypothetical protein